jgi:dipeptidyl aminopeptidase/acylaminoacyl peptidase
VILFVLISAAGLYSNHEGLDGTLPQPDATHTKLIQYGHGGPHWVTPDQYLRWQLSWAAIAVLGTAYAGLLGFGWRYLRRQSLSAE